MITAAAVAAAIIGYPQNQRCAFPDAGEYIMGAPRQYDASLISTDSSGAATVRCDSAAIIQTSQPAPPGYEPHCGGLYRASDATSFSASRSVSIVCIARYGARWRYATWSPARGVFDRFAATSLDCGVPSTVDTATIGYGAGALATIASIAKNCNSGSAHGLFYTTSGSTTSMSTGVAWWPTTADAALIMAAAAPEVDTEFLKTYAATAADRIATLGLNWSVWPDPADPVPAYTAGLTDFGKSHQVNEYDPNAAGSTGGSVLLERLRLVATAAAAASNCSLYVCGDQTLTDVVELGDSYMLELTDTTIVAGAVVFGTGGTGHLVNETHVLANPDNDGIHLTVARRLGMTETPEYAWHLEWENNSATTGGVWSERWFPLSTCYPADNTGYPDCADYGQRSQVLRTQTAGASSRAVAAVPIGKDNPCGGKWWNDYFVNLPAVGAGFYSGIQVCPTGSQLAAGVIDRKDGFVIDSTTMESVDRPNLFAAGTAAAALLGDTYYAPGATIGWAAYSGVVAGTAAANRAVAPTPDARLSPSTALIAFVVSVGVVAAGVAAHIAGWGRLHYALMTLATVGVWVGAIAAATATPRRQPAGNVHRALGWALVGCITATAALGTLRTVYRPRGNTIGIIHRVLAVLTLSLLTIHLLFITDEASVDVDATRLYPSAYETVAMVYALIIATIVVIVVARLPGRLGPIPTMTTEAGRKEYFESLM